MRTFTSTQIDEAIELRITDLFKRSKNLAATTSGSLRRWRRSINWIGYSLT